MSRTLRSKRLRALLWYAADGRCPRCGGPLGNDWEADHIVPWSVTKRTNVHDMQALCRRCNQEKGTAMPMRKHQIAFESLMQAILARQKPCPRFIIAHVAPGGGKSSLPVLALHYLKKAGIVDKLCWVTPNGTLRNQGADAFDRVSKDTGKPTWLFTHLRHNLKIVATGNEDNLSKGTDGYATTCHALSAAMRTAQEYGQNNHIKEFQSHRYVLFIDELHHYPVGGDWYNAIKPLMELARVVVCGTGTLDRNDKMPLPIPYADRVPDKTNTPEHHWITYSIRDATEDQAIIKTEFRLLDGAARYYDHTTKQEVEVEAFEDDETGAALMTALETQYARELLYKCLDDWLPYRMRVNPRSKMLVICSNTKQARSMLTALKQRGINDAEIATIREGDMANEVIERFRLETNPRIIVTVFKAYEGMDVPSITHIACLTHIRSKPWITQMIARGWRHDPGDDQTCLSWEQQRAFVFVPNDMRFRELIDEIEAEQDSAIRKMREGIGLPVGGGDGDYVPPSATITPLSSAAGEAYSTTLGGEWEGSAILAWAEDVRSQSPALASVSSYEIVEMLRVLRNNDVIPPTWSAKPPRKARAPEVSERDRITRLKQTLDGLVSEAARGDGERKRHINKRIQGIYGNRESIDVMGLSDAIADVRRWYGVSNEPDLD